LTKYKTDSTLLAQVLHYYLDWLGHLNLFDIQEGLEFSFCYANSLA